MARPSSITVVVAILGMLMAAMVMAAANQARIQRAEAKQAETSKRAATLRAPAAPPSTPALQPIAGEGTSAGSTAAPPRPEPSFPIATVRPGRNVALRSRPRGPVVARVKSVTEFGSRQTLAVAARRGRWLGVVSTTRPNGQLAWIEDRAAVRAASTKVSLHVDLSQRSLEMRRGGKVLRRATVGIGRPGSPTPTGRFAVTDKLPGSRFGAYYGCCIVALSGTQPNLPSGWKGGNRLAIHGTNRPSGIGGRPSAGCLQAGASDLRVLMKRVPLGTQVFIRR